jgi:hypothetical protein
MKNHKLIWLTSKTSKSGGVFVPTGERFIVIPTDVESFLKPILKPYDQDPGWFFTQIENSCSESPWAFVCLDEEYPIAGHFTANNQKDSGLFFSPYSKHPNPIPKNFVPKVGVIIIQEKSALEIVKKKSLLFGIIWDSLKDCDPTNPWLVISDPLPEQWLTQISPRDEDLWLSNR